MRADKAVVGYEQKQQRRILRVESEHGLYAIPALAISRGHIDKTTFWKMRLGRDLYVMTRGRSTGIPDVDSAHATGTNFTEDDLVNMLNAADVDKDIVTVEEDEIVDDLRRQIAARPDIKHRIKLSTRNMMRLGLE